MSSLQILIESIVTDLIDARFEADVKVANLATQYRNHPIMSSMKIPSLNISNVSVELKIAFDETKIEEVSHEASEDQLKVIKNSASSLRSKLIKLPSVTNIINVPRTRSAFGTKVSKAMIESANSNIHMSAEDRRLNIEKEINNLLKKNDVKLSAEDKYILDIELDNFEENFVVAPKISAKVPGILVGAKALSNLSESSISSVKFDVNLNDTRWIKTDIGEEETNFLLREEC